MDTDAWVKIFRQRARNARYASRGDSITRKQRCAILAGFGKTSRAKRISTLNILLGKHIKTINNLSREEAALIIDELDTPEFMEFIRR